MSENIFEGCDTKELIQEACKKAEDCRDCPVFDEYAGCTLYFDEED